MISAARWRVFLRAASVVLRYPIPRAVRFPSGMANSRGVAGTVSGATATFSIRKNGTQFATMQFAAGV
jgi:hypothetical protein